MTPPFRPGIPRAFRIALRRREEIADEVRDEIEHHVQLTVESLVAAGYTAEDARAEALHRLGDAPSLDHVHRRLLPSAQRREDRMRFQQRMGAIGDDTRYALRQLRRAPGFAAAVIITFALGIGANATMFGLVDRLLLREPMHVADPERVVELAATWPRPDGSPVNQRTVPYPTYKALRGALLQEGAEEVGASAWSVLDLSLGRGESARRAAGVLVSASFFPTLGVRPARGRFFLPEEDVEPVGAPVAVISHALWKRMYGGADSAIGRAVEIGQRSYTIIGVAPKGFSGAELRSVDVWLLISGAEGMRFPGQTWATATDATWIRVFVRIAPGVTAERIAARATPVNLALGPKRMRELGARMTATPLSRSIRNDRDGVTAKVAGLLAGVSGFVLLIACANVANLLLARALRRRQEIAVRLALGVTPGRLVVQLLTESVLLALIGGACALAVVQWGGSLVRTIILGDLGWTESPLDGRVLAYTLGASTLTGILAGLVPAMQASRPALTAALKPAGHIDGAAGRTRTRTILLVTQAALAVVLLVGAGFFIRSVHNLNALPLGMDPDRVLLATMDLQPTGAKAADVDALFRRIEERVRGLPGVRSAVVAATVPGRMTYMDNVLVPGRDSLPTPPGGGPYLNAVRPGYFGVMGTRILRGRDFSEADDAGKRQVTIVNETFARLVWPGEEAIGKCLRVGSDTAPCAEVIGVSENSRRQNWIEDEILHVYLPLSLGATRWMTSRLLVVRPVDGDPARLTAAVRRAMHQSAPNLPYAQIRPLEELYAGELRPWRLGAAMFGAFGLLAIVLAAVGLYGVIALDVTQRTRELGVRIALGARPGDVVRLVMRHALLVVAVGAALGTAIALVARPVVEPMLFRVSAGEPAIYVGVVCILLVVALVASLLPSWRATRVDPAVALRGE